MPENEPGLRYTDTEEAARFEPWTVEVDVHLLEASNPPKFCIESFLKDPDDKLVFNNNGRPGFKIVFHLHDETGEGFRFPEERDKDEAVWSQLGSTCPKRKVLDVLKPIRIFDDGTKLTVHNPNPHPPQGEFTYTLRVTNGRKWLDLDPGGVNQNGHYLK